MRTSKRLLCVLAVGCLGALAHASAAAACAGANVEASDQSPPAIEDSLLCLINERRTAAGLGPVTPNPKLHQAAAHHSNDMVANGYFAHDAPSGESFIDRITAAGYMKGARSWMVGENLIWGSGEFGTPKSMVQAWMESPAHRANLLRGRFHEIGIAAERGTPS